VLHVVLGSDEFAPILALMGPIRESGEWSNVMVSDRRPPTNSPRQKQNLLLNVRREIEQVHDLRHTATINLAKAIVLVSRVTLSLSFYLAA
jgi:hypothetical protein